MRTRKRDDPSLSHIAYQHISNKIVRSQSSLKPFCRRLDDVLVLLLVEDGVPHVLDVDGGLVLGLAGFL